VPVSTERKPKNWRRPALLMLLVIVMVASYSNRWLSRSGSSIQIRNREPLPDFTYRQLNGHEWRLRDHRGQVILLNFWATWCPPCREETPGLVRIQSEFGNQGFTVVAIAMDEDTQAVPSFVRQFRITYPVLFPSHDAALVNSVESLPTSLLLDKTGHVARTYVGAISKSVFAADIQHVLQERTTHG
jgi:cytochrome c biogenesis protein CcmG/thiol:disulfide interchange protein DsbE